MARGLRNLLQLIKQAYISAVNDDSKVFPIADVTYNSKISKAVRFSPYGLCSNAPLNSNVILLTIDGMESLKYALCDDMQNRFKNLKEGEVVLYNYVSGSYVYLKENGDVHINCKNDIQIDVVGDANITVTGDVTITAPTINLTGDVVISGEATIGGIDFSTHVHGGVEPGQSSTGVPQ